jgi:hypothetical protein
MQLWCKGSTRNNLSTFVALFALSDGCADETSNLIVIGSTPIQGAIKEEKMDSQQKLSKVQDHYIEAMKLREELSKETEEFEAVKKEYLAKEAAFKDKESRIASRIEDLLYDMGNFIEWTVFESQKRQP